MVALLAVPVAAVACGAAVWWLTPRLPLPATPSGRARRLIVTIATIIAISQIVMILGQAADLALSALISR